MLSWGSSEARLAVVELSRAGNLGESALIVAYMIPCDPPWSQACPVIGGFCAQSGEELERETALAGYSARQTLYSPDSIHGDPVQIAGEARMETAAISEKYFQIELPSPRDQRPARPACATRDPL